MRHTRLTGLAALLVAAACARTETPEQMQARMQTESDSARTAIEAAMAAFARHFNAGSADSMAMFYASDARIMPPGMPMVEGRDSIRATLAGYLSAGRVEGFTLAVQSVTANGPMAVERATFSMTFTPTGGQPMPSRGKSVALWRRQADGSWRVNASNLDLPGLKHLLRK